MLSLLRAIICNEAVLAVVDMVDVALLLLRWLIRILLRLLDRPKDTIQVAAFERAV